MSMKPNGFRWRPALGGCMIALALLSGTGCVVVEKQTTAVTFSADGKEMRVLKIYKGLHVAGDQPTNLENAKQSLADLTTNKKMLFLAPGWGIRTNELPNDPPEDKALMAILRKHVVVEDGFLFQDRDGRLCYAQPYTVRDVPRFVVAMNAYLSAQIKAGTEAILDGKKERPEWMDAATLRLLHQASTADCYEWLKIEPGRLSMTIPMTPEAFRALKQKALNPNDPKDLMHLTRMLSEETLSVDQRNDHVTLSLGVGSGQPLVLDGAVNDKVVPNKYDPDLVRYAHTLDVRFRDRTEAQAVLDKFLAGR